MKAAFAVALVALPLVGAQANSVDPAAYHAVARGDFSAAEERLETRLARGSTDPAVALNLAYIYGHTGRGGEALALYQRILSRGNVEMELPDGRPGWSHDIAARGMGRLSEMAAR